jgi:aminocarboxymuconate-semialdehyde decarboxylase
MPAETRLSIVAMTLCGVFKQVPESLRICVEHGSGSFAFWAGRMDNAWHKRRDVIGTSEDPPSHYSGRFYVDSAVFTEPALRLLAETVGTGHIMTGSGCPCHLGERPVGAVVRPGSFLTETERLQILRGDAAKFLFS